MRVMGLAAAVLLAAACTGDPMVGNWMTEELPPGTKGVSTAFAKLSLGENGRFTLGRGVVYGGPGAEPGREFCIVTHAEIGEWRIETSGKERFLSLTRSVAKEETIGCLDWTKNEPSHPVQMELGWSLYKYAIDGDTLTVVDLLPGALTRR